MQAEPSPWVWDNEARRYRYYDKQQRQWIWAESSGTGSTVQSAENYQKKKKKRDSRRLSEEPVEDPGHLHHDMNRLNVNRECEDEDEDPHYREARTPRPSYRGSPPTWQRALEREDVDPVHDDEVDEEDDGDDWNDDGDHNDGRYNSGNNNPHGGGDTGGVAERWVTLDNDVLMIDTNYTSKPFRRYHERIFKPGFVFQCMFNQEAGPSDNRTTATGNAQAENEHGQAIHTEIRIFVVLWNNGDHSSSCLSVQTYQQQGVAKSRLRKSNFAIFYSGPQIPSLLQGEAPNLARREVGMRDAIQMEMARPIDRVDPKSRIHLRAIHCCQHNWKIYPFGRVPQITMRRLLAQHREARDDPEGGKPGPKRPQADRRRNSTHQFD